MALPTPARQRPHSAIAHLSQGEGTEANTGTSACVCEGGSAPLALCPTSPVPGAGGRATAEETLLRDPKGAAQHGSLAPAPTAQRATCLLWAAHGAAHGPWAGLGGADLRRHT